MTVLTTDERELLDRARKFLESDERLYGKDPITLRHRRFLLDLVDRLSDRLEALLPPTPTTSPTTEGQE